MTYTARKILIDDLCFSDRSFFYNKGDQVFERKIYNYQPCGSLHLEIYDSISNIWNVSFEAENNFILSDDKLFIAPSHSSKAYIYSLNEQKCLDISLSHNQFIERTDYDSNSTIEASFIHQLNYLIVLNNNMISVFDINGLKWNKKIEGSGFDYSVSQQKVSVYKFLRPGGNGSCIRYDSGKDKYQISVFNCHSGELLSDKIQWSLGPGATSF